MNTTKSRQKRTLDTRRLYKFEKEWFRGEPNHQMKVLREIARDIWKEAGYNGY